MSEPADYVEKVYAGVLGKVIGVYLGRPFEGASNEDIERDLGEIWYYVHDRVGKPLVVTDDDISGTFTFLRALADHDGGRNISSEQIGRTWLNYLIEYQTVLWWGGMGVSTEHTAWLRLAAGISAPRSGSIELNGTTVAEQIGAQIFIDGWAMVAPGDPALAAELAGRAARVSHDGEAVYGAQAVAAMESLAFVESDMNKLLDAGLAAVPKNSIIHAVHHDVRSWAADHDDDWRRTFAKIRAKYGYDRYGGGCHMVPNHALMVMAWAHAPNNFQRALMIVNTAGWDTDCNSANVGCLMGIKGGLAGIHAGPDWQGPMADRVVIPTAEGTRGITDVLREADEVARLGRIVCGWAPVAPPKNGTRFHFSQPGARHGFAADDSLPGEQNVIVSNTAGRLRIAYRHLAPGRPACVSTPTYLTADWFERSGGYAAPVAPTLYSGQTVAASVAADPANAHPISVRLFARYYQRSRTAGRHQGELTGLASSEPMDLRGGAKVELAWVLPDTAGWPIAQLGLQLDAVESEDLEQDLAEATRVAGAVELDWLTWSGSPKVRFNEVMGYDRGAAGLPGWITNCKFTYRNAWRGATNMISNTAVGLAHTGTAEWVDYTLAGKMLVRLADSAGLAVRYGGLQRYVALLFNRPAGQLQLVRQYDGDRRVLASSPCTWGLNDWHDLKVTVRGPKATASADGSKVFDAEFAGLSAGGIACLTEAGTASFAELSVDPA